MFKFMPLITRSQTFTAAALITSLGCSSALQAQTPTLEKPPLSKPATTNRTSPHLLLGNIQGF